MVRFPLIASVLGIAACAHGSSASSPEARVGGEAHFTVTMFDNWSGARVRACVHGDWFDRMVPIDEAAATGLRSAWIDGEPLEIERGRIQLRPDAASSCVDYETRFAARWFRGGETEPTILSQSQWLWRPEPFPEDLRASLRFVLPGDADVSLPWPIANGIHLLDASAFFMDTYAVFGDFDRQVFFVADTRVEVAHLGEQPPKEDIRSWIGQAVRTVASVGGRFPRDRLHFVVKPVNSPASPVAFGMVRRGGGASILLLPSPYASAGALERDWVAVHELSHLWLPRVHLEDRWLSEGIATYLQEVLRARCGLQTGTRAWRRLRDGFDRGRRSGTGRALVNESRNMHRTGAYHRVYWAGAAFALEADARLRAESHGQKSLLTALDAAQASWGEEAGPLRASEVLRVLDEATGAGFFVTLGQIYAARSQFPKVTHATAPEFRALRAQIVAPAEDACAASGESRR